MFEDWSTNQPSNNAGGPGEDCVHIWSASCTFTSPCRWNDAPCTTTGDDPGDEFRHRPICKQEQTVYIFEAKSL